MVRYHTILFDADNTLLDFFKSEKDALYDALRTVGIEPNEDLVAKYSAINDALWKMLERGEIEKTALRRERFARFCKENGFDVDVDVLSNAYTTFLATKSYLMEGALETCRALYPHCRLYVITNGIKSVQEGRFNPSPLYPLFQKAYISEEIGIEKPHRGFFDAVEADIPQFDKKDTLVVGDSLTSDIAGGIAAGIDTCWFNFMGKPVPTDMPITYTIRHLSELVPLVLS